MLCDLAEDPPPFKPGVLPSIGELKLVSGRPGAYWPQQLGRQQPHPDVASMWLRAPAEQALRDAQERARGRRGPGVSTYIQMLKQAQSSKAAPSP